MPLGRLDSLDGGGSLNRQVLDSVHEERKEVLGVDERNLLKFSSLLVSIEWSIGRI